MGRALNCIKLLVAALISDGNLHLIKFIKKNKVEGRYIKLLVSIFTIEIKLSYSIVKGNMKYIG